MNRADRRRHAAEMGLNWRENMRASRVQAKLEEHVLTLSPARARQMLAEWASKQHSQEEVDLLNGVGPGADLAVMEAEARDECGSSEGSFK